MNGADIENRELFEEYRRTGSRAVRNEIVERYQRLVEYTVRRFRQNAHDKDDLRQVGFLGILHAVDRFDPDRGVQFSTFASRTIEGELKRHLRDRSWAVRPPRRAQELHLELQASEEALQQKLGRSPTVDELATEVKLTPDDVLMGLEARRAHRATSLDAPISAQSDRPLQVGMSEVSFDTVETNDLVARVLDRLPERDRTLLELRYIEGLSQPVMAERLGVSQSYLSRMLRRTVARTRARLANDYPDAMAIMGEMSA